MDHQLQSFDALTHLVYATLRTLLPESARADRRDRGSVSIEQVLWYAAAAVSVTVVAAVIWNAIKSQADTPVKPTGL